MNKRAYMLAYKNKESIEKVAAPILQSTSEMIGKATGGSGWGTAADVGSYFIPVVGDIRTGYDSVTDFTNMFGKGLTAKQRVGYGLSGLGNAGMTAASLIAGAATAPVGGVGSTAVTAAGKPAVMGIKSLFGLTPKLGKVWGGYKKGSKAAKAFVGKPAVNLMKKIPGGKSYVNWMTKNPYAGKAGFLNKMKYVGYGAPKHITPIAAMLYGEKLKSGTAPGKLPGRFKPGVGPEQYYPQKSLTPQQQQMLQQYTQQDKQASETELVPIQPTPINKVAFLKGYTRSVI
jgi:hypothetical protein